MRDKSKKRQLIMEAALQVFVEHGYEKTKIIDVARTAGIGKGTVYEYFESKEALFCCILEEYCEYYKEGVRKILSDLKDTGCQEKLLSVIHMTEFTNFPGLKQAIHVMLKFKFDTVCEILNEGVKNGEFRPVNIPLATAALMGASSAVDLISDEIQVYSDESLLDLLIYGLKA